MRPRSLKLGTHMDNGWLYCVYQNQAAAAYSSLYSFFFLSNFQTLKTFVTLFSGTMRLRRLKLGIHVDSGRMYCVYQNQAAAADSSLYFFIFLSLQFSNITIFVTLFSGTVRQWVAVSCIHGQWVGVSCIPESGCLFVPLFIFLSLQFSNIKSFRRTFLRNCEA